MDPAPCYRAGFLAPADADTLFRDLLFGVPWRLECLRLFGRPVTVPRLLAWYGDSGINYRYAAADHVCDGWLPSLAALRARLRTELGVSSNLVLLNRYRHGRDYMGWHRDDETGLQPAIVSLSLGATRRFLLRSPGAERSCRLDLEHGSALTMDGRWRHSLPRTRRPVGERINLTFRLVDQPQP